MIYITKRRRNIKKTNNCLNTIEWREKLTISDFRYLEVKFSLILLLTFYPIPGICFLQLHLFFQTKFAWLFFPSYLDLFPPPSHRRHFIKIHLSSVCFATYSATLDIFHFFYSYLFFDSSVSQGGYREYFSFHCTLIFV